MNPRFPTSLVWGVAVVIIATLGAVVAIALAVEDGARALSLVGLVLPTAGVGVTAIITLAKMAGLETKVDKVAQVADDLNNGRMDAKIRAGVADVLHPDHLNPDAEQQVSADRVRRDTHTTL